MNNLTVVSVLIILASTSCQANFTAGQITKLHEQAEVCNAKLGIPGYLHLEERAEDGDPTLEDDRSKKFLFCLFRQMQFVDDKGGAQRDEIVRFLSDGHDASTLPALLDMCIITKGIPENIAFHFYKCYFKQNIFKI